MLHSSIRLAIAVNMAFFATVVVLDTSSPWAGKLNLQIPPYCLKSSCFRIFLLDIVPLALDFCNELHEVILMVLQILVPPNKGSLSGSAVSVDGGLDEDVLEDTLWGDLHRRDIWQDLVASFHKIYLIIIFEDIKDEKENLVIDK